MSAKILVVDDQKIARESLADILRLEGYQVSVAANGDSALELVSEIPFELALLDIKMPGLDGIEVMREISKISPHTVIILLTAHGSLESAVKALRLQAHDYLTKPSTPQEILSSVAAGLSRRAEIQHKRMLLDQLDTSIQQLKTAEGISKVTPTSHQVVSFPDGVLVDLARREIWWGNEKATLTPTEGKLFQVLIENRGRVMSHRELVFLVQRYEISDWEAPEILRPLISRLRRKLVKFPGGDQWILNVRGTGYVLDIPNEE
jgi:DNA-binding response OmpR family regulator